MAVIERRRDGDSEEGSEREKHLELLKSEQDDLQSNAMAERLYKFSIGHFEFLGILSGTIDYGSASYHTLGTKRYDIQVPGTHEQLFRYVARGLGTRLRSCYWVSAISR
jgi:intein/homing endonuclease